MIKRTSIAALSLSASALLAYIVAPEGWTDTAVIPVKGDRPTIGPGLTTNEDGSPVKLGDTITPQQGLTRMMKHIEADERGIKQCVTAPLNQTEYDVMVDFTYQYGLTRLCGSTIVIEVNAGRYADSCKGYLEYKYITSNRPLPGWQVSAYNQGQPVKWRFDCSTPGNKTCAGVWERSKARYERCMGAQS